MAGSLQISRPMSVKEISAKADDFEFNPHIQLKYWVRTADTLLREAHIYEQEQNDQQAYLLFMRYAVLISDKLRQHPAAKDPANKPSLSAVAKTIPSVVERLEALKPRIDARYNNWQKAAERRRDAAAAFESERSGARTVADMAASDPAVAGNTTTLAAAENSDLAVKLAHNEIRRRETKRRGGRQLPEHGEQERRTAGLWNDWEAALTRDGQSGDDDEMRRNMESSHRRMDGTHDVVPDGVRRRLAKPPRPTRLPPRSSSSEYRYPSIQKSQPLHYEEGFDTRPKSDSPHLPQKPPKERLYDPTHELPPPRPDKGSSVHEEPPARPEKGTFEPQAARLSEQQNFTFKPSAYLENGNPLRTVFLPPTLRDKFLQVAAPNTRNNLETCGMLCGTLISNALFISQVVIPEQESTSDTCETVNESAFFDYCAAEDLMVLGWIHTHPTQTCFMSSRDLHTHCGYQIMMPESIAIVCAPSKNPSWGVFRLTDPPGMQSVLNCRKTGLFHPHDESNIYTDALRPGHVFEAQGLEFQVVDLRPRK